MCPPIDTMRPKSMRYGQKLADRTFAPTSTRNTSVFPVCQPPLAPCYQARPSRSLLGPGGLQRADLAGQFPTPIAAPNALGLRLGGSRTRTPLGPDVLGFGSSLHLCLQATSVLMSESCFVGPVYEELVSDTNACFSREKKAHLYLNSSQSKALWDGSTSMATAQTIS